MNIDQGLSSLEGKGQCLSNGTRDRCFQLSGGMTVLLSLFVSQVWLKDMHMNSRFLRNVLSTLTLFVNLENVLNDFEMWVRLEVCVIRRRCK